MKTRAKAVLELYQVAAGLSDTSTGLLLLVAPLPTLRLMHVTQSPTPVVFNSFIGAFVLGVGLTYLLVSFRAWQGRTTLAEWESQWRATATIRSCIAIFLIAEIAMAHLQPAWGLVAVSDAALACLQWIGLHRGWLRAVVKDTLA